MMRSLEKATQYARNNVIGLHGNIKSPVRSHAVTEKTDLTFIANDWQRKFSLTAMSLGKGNKLALVSQAFSFSEFVFNTQLFL